MSISQPRPGLRERKRAATRQHIAETAMAMFLARGFDEVTIAEIADAAEVSKVTVFNYFPRKEDLFFDLLPEAHSLLEAAVAVRGQETTPLAAVRALLLDLARRRHPFAPAGDGSYDGFLRVVSSSPVLIARAREAAAELEDHLARLFADAGGPLADAERRSPEEAADARLAAALVAAAYATIYCETARRQLAGEPAEALLADHASRVDDAFDRLERAISARVATERRA
ncbi:TetR family transcriptional regulator [Microbacterium sp. BWT-B31]|uniref:TetR/AcrR family transcriptional regulator n=1 Tax=Microbacterium sp. BWT-B31 TaxID=3232072 RepID=UPI003527BC6E